MPKKIKENQLPKFLINAIEECLGEWNYFLDRLNEGFNPKHSIFLIMMWENDSIIGSCANEQELQEAVYTWFTRGHRESYSLVIVTPDGTFNAVPTGYKLEPA